MTFIIAEVGSNWLTLDHCIESVIYAKRAGADAVKFQLYDDEALYGPVKGFGLVKEHLSLDWLPKIHKQCEDSDIEFMCSAFSPKLLAIVNHYVKRHKLASAEMRHPEMLQLLNGWRKPVLVSTGGHPMNHIKDTYDYLKRHCDVTIMHCVSAYPAKIQRLGALPDIYKSLESPLYCPPLGFSDHSLDACVTPVMAMRSGANVIEKHVNFVGALGPDSPHSLNGAEFAHMVNHIRSDTFLCHERDLELSGEKDMVTKHHRRLIAIQNIAPGDQLILNKNCGYYRSLKPSEGSIIQPQDLEHFIVNETILRGESI